MQRGALLSILSGFALCLAHAQKAPTAKPFERFDDCTLAPDEWTDGDSFRVRLPDGRLELLPVLLWDDRQTAAAVAQF